MLQSVPGASGRAFMNWYQPLDRHEYYSTLVNSYLTAGVEYGLWVVFLALGGIAWLSVFAWKASRAGNNCSRAAGASLLVWAVVNIFSTLFIGVGLWIVPLLSLACLLWQFRTQHALALALIIPSCVFGVCSVLLLFAVGQWLNAQEGYRVTPNGHRSVTYSIATYNDTAPEIWKIWPDQRVLGPLPGKELRNWACRIKRGISFSVEYISGSNTSRDDWNAPSIMLCGRAVERAAVSPPSTVAELWLIHPSAAPPMWSAMAHSNSVLVLILPEIDETGLNGAWIAWARHANARLEYSPACGLDIRLAWPNCAPRI